MRETQVTIVGAGLVGMAIAYGLSLIGRQVRVLDEGDDGLRAARGNFGLLWVQGKGYQMSPYAQWTRDSVALWPRLDASLRQDTTIDLHLRQPGGFQLCLSDTEMAEETHRLHWLRDALDGDYPFDLLDGAQLRRRLPGIGPAVVGASYCPLDGHVNPLKLLHALHMACRQRGVEVIPGQAVQSVERTAGGFRASSHSAQWDSPQLVMCAGLGNHALGAQLGLDVPVVPNRGQILVSERLEPFLHYPTSNVRQTDEGTVQLGDSMESTGLDDRTSAPVLANIARRAVACFPRLANVRMVRAWGALRVLSADGFPIYQATDDGAFIVNCHSGVTLAAVHALRLAPWIAGEFDDPAVQPFGLERFHRETSLPPAAIEARHAH